MDNKLVQFLPTGPEIGVGKSEIAEDYIKLGDAFFIASFYQARLQQICPQDA